MDSALFVPALAVVAFVLGIVAFQFFRKDQEGLEEEKLEEVVKGDVKEIVELWGIEVKKPISYSLFPRGLIQKAFKYNKMPLDESDDDVTKEDFFYFKIRPQSKIDRFLAKLTDDLLDMDNYTHYMVVEQDYIEDGEVITVSDEWNPKKMAGVWLPANEKGSKFVSEKTHEETLKSTMKVQKDLARAVNELNLEHVNEKQKLEAIKEMQGSDLQRQIDEWMEGRE